MKKKKEFLLMPRTIFPIDILFTTADHEKIVRYIEKRKKYILNDEEKESLQISGRAGRTVQLLGKQIIVMVKKEKTSIGFDLCVLVHELIHAVLFVFAFAGHKINEREEELLPYYVQYLLYEILKEYQ